MGVADDVPAGAALAAGAVDARDPADGALDPQATTVSMAPPMASAEIALRDMRCGT
ncbi:MAG: hypothetical protein M3Z00_00905 [Actinomycetota bacterium]|nr:hypothetical protein [Actinomycetota bacterium]